MLDMTSRRTVHLVTLLATAAMLGGGVSGQTRYDWTEWGGPNRDFMLDATGLASSWPEGGPRRLWSRALGEGHSAILSEGGRLYTMYRPLGLLSAIRRSQEEVVVALDAATGQTIWEFRYPASTSGMNFTEGAGPHSTPLIVGDRLYAMSSRLELFALDKTTGRLVWSHDFVKAFGAAEHDRGFAASPLHYKGSIIVSVGGRAKSVGAFDARTGAVRWRAGDLEISPASQILIDVDGQTQLVVFGGDRIGGMNPDTGELLWSHPHRTDFGLNISTPVWSPADHLLLFSSAYGTGTRALEIRQAGGKSTVTERWHSQRVRVHIGTILRIGDFAYTSSGDFGPAFITAVNVKTGAVAWQSRAFARAQLLYADNKVIVLDEDGTLGLATVSGQGLNVLAKAAVMEGRAWTPPTLVGTRLYVRDRQTIAAFDLS